MRNKPDCITYVNIIFVTKKIGLVHVTRQTHIIIIIVSFYTIIYMLKYIQNLRVRLSVLPQINIVNKSNKLKKTIKACFKSRHKFYDHTT